MPVLKEWIYILKVSRLEMLTQGATEREDEIVGQHFAYLQDNLAAGITILMGRSQNNDENTFGIVIFRTASEKQARKFMEADPAVNNSVMQTELFPYRIALMEGRG